MKPYVSAMIILALCVGTLLMCSLTVTPGQETSCRQVGGNCLTPRDCGGIKNKDIPCDVHEVCCIYV